jgi:hypothetical protein
LEKLGDAKEMGFKETRSVGKDLKISLSIS